MVSTFEYLLQFQKSSIKESARTGIALTLQWIPDNTQNAVAKLLHST